MPHSSAASASRNWNERYEHDDRPGRLGCLPGRAVGTEHGRLLLQERRNARHRRPSQGDGGVDVYNPVDGGYHVYQIKRHAGSLTSRQKAKITKSLEQVRRTHRLNGPVLEWSLVLPLDPTSENDEWFDELTAGAGFPCGWLGRPFWDSEAAKHPHVIDHYIRGGKDRLIRRVTSLTSLLSEPDQPLQPSELLTALGTYPPEPPSTTLAPSGLLRARCCGQRDIPDGTAWRL